MSSHDPAERILIARQAALTRWAREDGTKNAVRAQRGLLAKFEREVDPNNELPLDVRIKRAERLRQAHMIRLARASAATRKVRSGKITEKVAFRDAAEQANKELAGGVWTDVPFEQWARPDEPSDRP